MVSCRCRNWTSHLIFSLFLPRVVGRVSPSNIMIVAWFSIYMLPTMSCAWDSQPLGWVDWGKCGQKDMESRPPNILCFPAVNYLSLSRPLHIYTMTIGAVHGVVLEKEHIGTFPPYFWPCRKDISAPRLTVYPSLEKVWVLKKRYDYTESRYCSRFFRFCSLLRAS